MGFLTTCASYARYGENVSRGRRNSWDSGPLSKEICSGGPQSPKNYL